MAEWHLLTGEYPPDLGGVGDYTAQLAGALALQGDEVHVWHPEGAGVPPEVPGVESHPLPGHFGPRALARLSAWLDRSPGPRRLLVQYVPGAFGWRSMNLLFCLWLYTRRRRETIWAMFHEVAYPFVSGQPWRRQLLACVHRTMAWLVARSARRCFVSIPSWEPRLRGLAGEGAPIEWVPIPSNLPLRPDPVAVSAARARYAPRRGQTLLGHFGTFGDHIAPLVAEAFPLMLADRPDRTGLLVGRRGESVAEEVLRHHPELRGRLFATGSLEPDEVSAHLAACDLLVQPYPDGASSRRTSLMAGLALGVPTVSTQGDLTEPIWRQEGLIGLAPAGSGPALAGAAEALLSGPPERLRRLGKRGREGYGRYFRLERTVETLRSAPALVTARVSVGLA
jgi:glycosyltransferase involved in cell wall biosynthesis